MSDVLFIQPGQYAMVDVVDADGYVTDSALRFEDGKIVMRLSEIKAPKLLGKITNVKP